MRQNWLLPKWRYWEASLSSDHDGGVPVSYKQISQEQYAAIGKFIVEFSGLEGSIKLGISMLTPFPEDMSEELLAGYDFAMACTVLSAVGSKRLPAPDADRLSSHLKRAMALNTERVRVAHGSWQTFGQFHAKHTSRQKLKVTEHYRHSAELELLAAEAENVSFHIFSICFEFYSAT